MLCYIGIAHPGGWIVRMASLFFLRTFNTAELALTSLRSVGMILHTAAFHSDVYELFTVHAGAETSWMLPHV